MELLPTAKEANDGGNTKGSNSNCKDSFQTNHVRIDDDGNLRARKSFADLGCAGRSNYCRVDLGKFNGNRSNQLVVEGALCCCEKESSTNGHEDWHYCQEITRERYSKLRTHN